MSLWCSTETGRPCPRVLFMFLLSGWLGVAPAQVMTDNDEGERILLMPDGSWRYLEPGDSIYLYQGPGEENLLKYYTYLSAAELFEGEVMDVVDNTQEKLYTLENRYDKARSDGDIYRLSSLRTEREELQTQLSSQQDQLQYVRSLIKDIKKIGTRKKYQKLDKIEIPERYLTEASSDAPSAAYAYNDGSTLEAPDGEASQISGSKRKERTRSSIRKDRDIVSREQKEEEKSTSGEQGFDQAVKRKREKESRSASSEPLATSSKKSKRREAKIKEVKAKESSEDDAKVKRKSAIPAPQNDPVKMENAGATKASNGRYVVPNVLIDEDPLPNCRFAFDGVDQFNGGVRREMEGEILFTHTDPRLRAYLKGREYVTAEAYLSSVAGGYRYLTLTVRIASKNARREYGSLRSSSLLNIRLLDGSIVSLFSQDGSSGTIDPQSGDLVYKVLYGIDYQKTKLLAKSEVDQVRIVWSSGYEDYEVYNVDFFTRQLDCLNAKLE